MTAPLTPAEDAALDRAIELARHSGVVKGPNPAVGCVLLDSKGSVLAEGWHRGPGTAHAEVDALTHAAERAQGATAVVSMEPCSHHGRTPPCTQALLASGIGRVIFGQTDPNPQASGGARVLRTAGVEVIGPARSTQARAVNRVWNRAAELGRPLVVWKVAASMDGRIAAADGTSKWITSPESREQSHQLRAAVDAVLTGTGTALADRPALTARPGGRATSEQPLRAVMGHTSLPTDHPLADALILDTHDPREALTRLWQADVRRVMLECGPRLASAFLAADLIDDVVWFSAPLLLGARGLGVVAEGPATLSDASRWHVVSLGRSGPDVRIDLRRKET